MSGQTPSLTTSPNGPYLVRGPLDLTDAAGNTMHIPAGKSAALCRCGRSAAKPFCDGTHSEDGFHHPQAAPAWALQRFAAAPPEQTAAAG